MLREELGDLEGVLCGVGETAVLILGLRILIVANADHEGVLVFNLNCILTRL